MTLLVIIDAFAHHTHHTHTHTHTYLRHSTAQQSEVSCDEQRCFSQHSTVYRLQPNLILGTGHNVALQTTKQWKRCSLKYMSEDLQVINTSSRSAMSPLTIIFLLVHSRLNMQ